MCLRIKGGQKSVIAQEDITVYKVYYTTDKEELISYYQRSVTKQGEQPRVKLGIGKKNPIWSDDGTQAIHEGYHSFKLLYDAKKFVEEERIEYHSRPKWFGDLVIHQCTIPKGAEYYKGIFNFFIKELTSFASDQLIVEKQMQRTKRVLTN